MRRNNVELLKQLNRHKAMAGNMSENFNWKKLSVALEVS